MPLNGPVCASSESHTSGSLAEGNAAFIWLVKQRLDLIELASGQLSYQATADGFEVRTFSERKMG